MSFKDLNAFKDLKKHSVFLSDTKIKTLFDREPDRLKNFTIEFEDIYYDFSKNLIDKKGLEHLIKLAEQSELEDNIKDLFNGAPLNFTENRPALHTALRMPETASLKISSTNIIKEVHTSLKKMEAVCQKIHSGEHKGATDQRITDIVNIGIGGSDLGPKMVCYALKKYKKPGINIHFVSNIDYYALKTTLMKLNPATTLFIITSKSFTTDETLTNARSARNWLENHIDPKQIGKHLIAITANTKKAKEFGLKTENILEFWDFVGGRYSMWSAVGLSIALYIGFDNFKKLLEGAHSMDMHFLKAPLEKNIPVVAALINIWYINFFNTTSYAILPYSQPLKLLPSYLQQLMMESLGKSTNKEGSFIDYKTCPLIFGEPGTDGQHSFYQLIHQGSQIIPSDFIAFKKSLYTNEEHQNKLLANFIAQTESLMLGKNKTQIETELKEKGLKPTEIQKLLPHKIFHGNRPSNSILIDELTPSSLGKLIAIYEHKTFVESIIWNINAFDQYGVELGKALAKKIYSDLNTENEISKHDISTAKLIKKIKS
jgi:glucose-6-phosphate isomerase